VELFIIPKHMKIHMPEYESLLVKKVVVFMS
jgi:hypothetical protein